MPLNKDVGNWIKDFMKSNAPQFKGKSKEERRDMALAAYREKYGSLNEQDDHVDPMVAKAYKKYIKAKKDSAADIDFAEDPEKAYRYYSKKLNNTYSTKADRDAIEGILKKKYGSAIEEASKEEMDKFAKFQKDLQKTMSTQGWKDLEDRAEEERKEREARKSKPVKEIKGFEEFKETGFKLGDKVKFTGSAHPAHTEPIKLTGTIEYFEPADEIGIRVDGYGAFIPFSKIQSNIEVVNEEEGATAAEEDKFHRELDKLVHKTFGHSSDEKKIKEEAKPDFLDLDKDGDKKEPMKKAAKDKAVKKAMKKVSEIVKVKTPEEAAKVTKANPDAEVEVVSEVLTEGHNYDYEGKMAQSQLLSIVKNARDLFQMIDSNTQLKAWVQSKLTKAEDYLDSVRTYLEGESLTSTAPAMFENEAIKDETGVTLSIGDVVKGGDGKMYQIIYSYSEGVPMMVPFDLKRKKTTSLRDRVYFNDDSSVNKKLSKVLDFSATKGGFMK